MARPVLLPLLLPLLALFLSWESARAQCRKAISGGAANGDDYAYGYAADSLGNQYLCGTFYGNARFGNITLPGTQDGSGFLAKFNPQGGCDWAYRVGSFDDVAFFDVEVDRQGNVHTVFFLEGDSTFLGITPQGDGAAVYAVLNPQGGLVRSHVFTEPATYYDLAIDAPGNVYLTGEYYSAIGSVGGFPVPGQEGYLIVKLDATANPQWVRTVSRQTSAAFHETPHVGERPGGGVAFNAMYFDEDKLGTIALASGTGQGLLAAVFDAQGTLVRHWTSESSDMVVPFRPAFDAAGDLYSSGYHEGSITAGATTITTNGFGDAFIVKMLAGGGFGWARSVGTARDEVGDGIVNAGGRLFLTIDFDSALTVGATTVTGFHDMALIEFTPDNRILGMSTFGGPGVESAFGITANKAGEPVLYGTFQNSIASGACQLTSHGDNDAFAATLNLATATQDKLPKNDVALIPNPSSGGAIRILGLSENSSASLTLRDASGQTLHTWTGKPGDLESGLALLRGSLPSGLYSVSIRQGAELHNLKWAVQR